jgi:hypothetical protein
MKSIITPLLLVLTLSAWSQRYVDTHNPKDEEVKSLLGKGNDLNGYGQLDMKVTDVKDNRVLITGAQGGVLVNRRYFVGLAGYGIATEVQFDGMVGAVEKPLNLHGGYGGMVIGGMVGSKEVIHLVFPVFLGAGSLDVSDKDYFTNNPSDAEFTIERSAFMVIEPAAQIEFNITEHFRLAAGMSYRYVTGTELRNVSDADLSGGAVTVSFRFGRF